MKVNYVQDRIISCFFLACIRMESPGWIGLTVAMALGRERHWICFFVGSHCVFLYTV